MMVCMDQIIDNLYLGGIAGAFDPDYLRGRGITHILSLLDRPLPEEHVCNFKYMFVYALDLYDTDLLQEMEKSLAFIDEGIRDGAVLVHCQAGASRSATVVAAYVMRRFSMDTLTAMELLKKQRSIVKPNEGFLRQLDLFQVMGWHVDEKHQEFRRYILSKVAVQSKSGFKNAIPASVYRSESALQPSVEKVYRCKKCRQTLFHTSALMIHGKGQGESAFDWRSKRQIEANGDEVAEAEVENCQASLFIEPIEWMKGQIETVEGKLSCPKCKAKLGSFVWYGQRCPCGAWAAPAFHIQTSKVDALQEATSAKVVQPFRPSVTLTSHMRGTEAPL